MGLFRQLVKNILPYYFVKKFQFRHLDPGGYYSPIPSIDEIRAYDFNCPVPKALPGIDLNDDEQLALLDSFDSFYKDLPFSDEKSQELRYYYKNNYYGYSDAIALCCMIRHLNPKKIIEVGSGFSSSMMLDTNDIFMANQWTSHLLSLIPKD